MGLDANGKQGSGSTFSSKKVDWTQESGSPRWKRERDRRKQEDKLHQVTRHSGLSVIDVPSPCLPLPNLVTNSIAPLPQKRSDHLPTYLTEGSLFHQGSPLSLPFLPPESGDDPTTAISIPLSEQPHSPGRQAGRTGRRFQDLPASSPHRQPQRYLLTITTTMMAQIAPSMIIILQFFHQYFLFSLAALLSNCDAPTCKASARSSSSDSISSLFRTLSTFTRMISTTSSTCA